MGNVNIPNKNAKIYKIFKEVSSKKEKQKQTTNAKIESKIKTILLSNLSDIKPIGT